MASMRWEVLLLFAVGQMSAQTDHAASPEPAKPQGSVHGIVSDSLTGAPLANAYVQVWRIVVMKGMDIGPRPDREGTPTDPDGRYAIPSVRAGDIVVKAKSDSHEGAGQSVNLADGEDMTLDFALSPWPSISGRVLDENQKPADALVWLIDSRYRDGLLVHGRIGPGITDENGTFTFASELEPGRSYYVLAERPLTSSVAYRDPGPLEARAPIEQTTYYGDASSLRAAVPLSLREGEHRLQTDIGIRKSIPYCVGGRVLVSGEPAAILLTVQPADLAGLTLTPFSFESAEDGSFHVCGLTPGEYSVSPFNSRLGGSTLFTVAHSDLQDVLLHVDAVDLYLDLSWEGDPPAEQHPTLLPAIGVSYRAKLTADGVTQMERIEIRPGPAIGEGSEIAVTLSADGLPSPVSKAAPAPYSGPFGQDLVPGDYSVEAQVAPGCYVKELAYNGVPIPNRVLHLAAGMHGTLRVVASKGGATVTVKVTDSDDKPLTGAVVVLAPERVDSVGLLAALAQRGLTGANGIFQSQTLAPGKYRVLALTRPFRDTPDDFDKALRLLRKAETVELGYDKSNANISLKAFSFE